MHDSMDVFTFVKFAQHLNIKLSGELYHILVSGEYEKRFPYTFPVFKHQKHKDQKIQELFETLDGLKYYNCNLKPTNAVLINSTLEAIHNRDVSLIKSQKTDKKLFEKVSAPDITQKHHLMIYLGKRKRWKTYQVFHLH
uniref:Uncharacterized protein n=1 Tax=Panagrolaimus superbus TaxID=310955 RepID=A0A914Y6W9_9BILA